MTYPATNLAASALEMCLDWVTRDKAHSWELAQQFAKLDPYQLSSIPAELTEEMLRRKNEPKPS